MLRHAFFLCSSAPSRICAHEIACFLYHAQGSCVSFGIAPVVRSNPYIKRPRTGAAMLLPTMRLTCLCVTRRFCFVQRPCQTILAGGIPCIRIISAVLIILPRLEMKNPPAPARARVSVGQNPTCQLSPKRSLCHTSKNGSVLGSCPSAWAMRNKRSRLFKAVSAVGKAGGRWESKKSSTMARGKWGRPHKLQFLEAHFVTDNVAALALGRQAVI